MEKAVRLEPSNPAVYASLGLARMCAGDIAGARRDLLRSLDLNPAQPAVRDYVRKLGR
jgi:Flp pilus assembly protein TadD